MDEKLGTTDVETRVPINLIGDTDRKYEFSFLSRSKKIALNYCHERTNLSDEKFQILKENSKGIQMIYIVDVRNGGSNGLAERIQRTEEQKCFREEAERRKLEFQKKLLFVRNAAGYYKKEVADTEILWGAAIILSVSIQEKSGLTTDSFTTLIQSLPPP